MRVRFTYCTPGKTPLTQYTNEGTGENYKINEYLAANYEALKDKYRSLTSTERKELIANLTNLHKVRVCIICENPKAVEQDVNAAFLSMEDEVCAQYIAKLFCSMLTIFAVGSAVSLNRNPRLLSHGSRLC